MTITRRGLSCLLLFIIILFIYFFTEVIGIGELHRLMMSLIMMIIIIIIIVSIVIVKYKELIYLSP